MTMWPLPEEMVVEATGDSKAIPILWGPTLFYYCNILVQFSMIFGLIGWMAYSYFTERDEMRKNKDGSESGDTKKQEVAKNLKGLKAYLDATDASNKDNVDAKVATEATNKDNEDAQSAHEATDLLLRDDAPRVQATVSDEALLKRKTSDDAVRKNSSEELLAHPRGDITAGARKTPRTGRSLERLLASKDGTDTSGSELESEAGDTPGGMSIRRRRSKRLLAGDGVAQ